MSDRAEVLMSGYTREQIELLKRTVAKDASDDELALFLMRCKRTGLDPFANQIYFRKHKTREGDRVTIQTGIDGLLAIADDTGKLAGIDEPVFEGAGLWNNGNEFPLKATVTVYKVVEGSRVPFTASALWHEYYPGDDDKQGWMWRKMPYGQLSKCALAKALRLGFPQPLGGLYSSEELEQAREETSLALAPARTINRGGPPPQQQRQKPVERPALPPPPEVKAFNELLRAAGKKWPEVVAELKPRYPDLTPATKFKDIPAGALAEAELWLKAHVPPGPDDDPPSAKPSPAAEGDAAALERLGHQACGDADSFEVWLGRKGLSPAALPVMTAGARDALKAELERLRDEREKPPGE